MPRTPHQNTRPQTRIVEVMNTIRSRIHHKELSNGSRLPSIRVLARVLEVSNSTVVEAYERLAAEGVVVARRGSGYFAAKPSSIPSASSARTLVDQNVDSMWMVRQSLKAPQDALLPGCGWLPHHWMPQEAISKALRITAKKQSISLTEYSKPFGHLKLRNQVQRRISERGVEASIDQIALVGSSTQAIDIVCRALLSPGDVVIVDDPCYYNLNSIIVANGAKVVSVPYTRLGPDYEKFAQAIKEHSPKLYITNATTHNPTGSWMRASIARNIIRSADQNGFYIIEDDVFADFERQPVVRLAALDGLERVIYIGSFSKTLAAGIRCGFIAANLALIEYFSDLYLSTTFGCQTIATELVYNVLVGGGYRRHVESLKTKLADSMSVAVRRLQSLGIKPWLDDHQGMYVWAELPDELDASKVAQWSVNKNVLFAPGNAFSHSGSCRSFMRFNVAQCANPRVFEVLHEAMLASADFPINSNTSSVIPSEINSVYE